MRTFIFFLFFSFLTFQNTHAQYREPSGAGSGGGLTDRIYFGGGGGFNAGSNFFSISVSPLMGYKITERFSAGVQITYQYTRITNLRAHNYGGGPFLRFNVTQKFFAYTEYEYMNFGLPVLPPNESPRFDFTSYFVGLGYTEPIGDVLAFNVIALYNLLYQDGTNSPYNSPFVFRVGIVAGLF